MEHSIPHLTLHYRCPYSREFCVHSETANLQPATPRQRGQEMAATATRGSVGKASYEAVRKHIDAGKKATEAFKLVAQETGRSTATVQTAYYRVARSLPGGGGVQLRPRKKSAARKPAAATATTASASKPVARRGRPP